VATLKIRLAKRQRQHSIPPLNFEELKEDKAVQFAAEVTNRFMALETAQNEVTPEDLWKGTKTVLLEVARETIGSVKSQKKKKWISDETYAAVMEKREAKGKDKNRYQELKAEVQRKLRVDKEQQLEGMCMELEAANTHTQPFNGLLFGTTRVGRYQKKRLSYPTSCLRRHVGAPTG